MPVDTFLCFALVCSMDIMLSSLMPSMTLSMTQFSVAVLFLEVDGSLTSGWATSMVCHAMLGEPGNKVLMTCMSLYEISPGLCGVPSHVGLSADGWSWRMVHLAVSYTHLTLPTNREV